MYTAIHTNNNFDGFTCMFDADYMVGRGAFMYQFLVYVFLIDFQALSVRVYLFTIMNKKHHSGQKTFEEKRDADFLEMISHNQDNTKSISQRSDIQWKILLFIPQLVIGMTF